MNDQGNILSVLSGNNAIKINIGVDLKSMVILGAVVFFAVLAAIVISKNIS